MIYKAEKSVSGQLESDLFIFTKFMLHVTMPQNLPEILVLTAIPGFSHMDIFIFIFNVGFVERKVFMFR